MNIKIIAVAQALYISSDRNTKGYYMHDQLERQKDNNYKTHSCNSEHFIKYVHYYCYIQ